MEQRRGFTIIELIVVIAIIAVLASIIIANLSSYSVKARNSKRLEDIVNYVKALTIYFANNGKYPNGSLCCLGSVASNGNPGSSNCGPSCAANAALQPYFPALPATPWPNSGFLEPYYYDTSTNSTYTLYWEMETTGQSCGIGFTTGNGLGMTFCRYNSQ